MYAPVSPLPALTPPEACSCSLKKFRPCSTTFSINSSPSLTPRASISSAERTVTGITSGSTLTFTPATEATVAAPVEITFEKAQEGADTVLRQIDVQADGNDGLTGNIIIKGAIEVSSIPNDDTINIELDNFINVTT